MFHFCGSWFEKEKEFLKLFDGCTEGDHFGMIYRNRHNTIEDAYSSWKAGEVKDFKLEYPVV